MPSTTPVVRRRIRNRIIEYLELASSFEAQASYQAAVPLVHVPSEVINQWEDWVLGDWRQYIAVPVFSQEEVEAVGKYCVEWESVCSATPQDLGQLRELIDTAPWRQLATAASEALAVFQRTGPSPESPDET